MLKISFSHGNVCVYIIRRYFRHHYLVRSACVVRVWPRCPIVGHNKGLEIQASGFLPGCGGPLHFH